MDTNELKVSARLFLGMLVMLLVLSLCFMEPYNDGTE